MADEAQDATTTEKKAETERITVADFLENVGPSSARHVSDLWYEESSGGRSHRKIVTPAIRIHCESDNCGGVRTFRYKEGQTYFNNEGEIHSSWIMCVPIVGKYINGFLSGRLQRIKMPG